MKKFLPYKFLYSALLIAGMISFTSCSDDENNDVDQGYDIPSTYNFDNVSFSGQTIRLDQVGKLTAEMKKGNEVGVEVSEQTLTDIYNEDVSGKKIQNKVQESFDIVINSYFPKLEAASMATEAGSEGVAGVVTSHNGEKSYLFDAEGIEYTQLIEKGLMGALMYHQATAVYFGDSKMNVDNETVEEGKGTEMQHHWDEALGYFSAKTENGVTVFDDSRYWAKYAKKTEVLKTSENIYNAFIKGRAAIGAKDYSTRDEQISIIRRNWEIVVAGTAVHYLNGAKDEISNGLDVDYALKNHQLSEAYAFILGLQFNPESRVSAGDANKIAALLGNDFYKTEAKDVQNAIDEITSLVDELKDVAAQL
ncbi:DUF4856 domain-containing protein [Aureibacter tunicatorum]|uniref:DUF4856 domain-containing protein n=1 Tax=Aureibacter tunicatorum TaxID=866807 RepID=A0AAE3XJS3_9BACT|nr:DUF4856 domain-containing protein [Aureibacter tunicatorum]MDR6237755.1 hypothetical protein [Aureibacter tunicatorum]BDD02790.1 DUF4856 domain-containing protein [Aureibacter tunicatorum]